MLIWELWVDERVGLPEFKITATFINCLNFSLYNKIIAQVIALKISEIENNWAFEVEILTIFCLTFP